MSEIRHAAGFPGKVALLAAEREEALREVHRKVLGLLADGCPHDSAACPECLSAAALPAAPTGEGDRRG